MEKEPHSFSFSDLRSSTPGRILIIAGVIVTLLQPEVMFVLGAVAAAMKAAQVWPGKEWPLWAACSALAVALVDPLAGLITAAIAIALGIGLPRKLARLEKERSGAAMRNAAINATRESQVRSAKAARVVGAIRQAARISEASAEAAAAMGTPPPKPAESTALDAEDLVVDVPDTVEDLLGWWNDEE